MSVPVITSAIAVTAQVGQAFTYNIVGTQSPTGYNAYNLPAGLTVNTSTGAITGTPTASGVTNAALLASNGSGNTYGGLLISVAPAVGPLPVDFSAKFSGANTPSLKTSLTLPAGSAYGEYFQVAASATSNALATAAATSYVADVAGAVTFSAE